MISFDADLSHLSTDTLWTVGFFFGLIVVTVLVVLGISALVEWPDRRWIGAISVLAGIALLIVGVNSMIAHGDSNVKSTITEIRTHQIIPVDRPSTYEPWLARNASRELITCTMTDRGYDNMYLVQCSK